MVNSVSLIARNRARAVSGHVTDDAVLICDAKKFVVLKGDERQGSRLTHKPSMQDSALLAAEDHNKLLW